MSRLRLDLEWRTTALTLLLTPALVALGFWQLERAAEKTALAARHAQRAAMPPLSLAALLKLDADAHAHRRVRLSGQFLPGALVFVDNQTRQGRYGHDVVGLFRDEHSGQLVLLNRGWVPGDPARRALPRVAVPEEPQSLLARVYVPPGEPYLLAADRFEPLTWPLLVQTVNARPLREAIEAATGEKLFARELRLDPDQAAGFRRDWPVVNVSPQKHQGYALQWFSMAGALLLLFVLRSSNVLCVLRAARRGATRTSAPDERPKQDSQET